MPSFFMLEKAVGLYKQLKLNNNYELLGTKENK